jgi:hypothetical protein
MQADSTGNHKMLLNNFFDARGIRRNKSEPLTCPVTSLNLRRCYKFMENDPSA